MNNAAFDEREYLADIAARLLELDASGTTDSAPEPVTFPVAPYFDEAGHRLEQAQMFSREPQLVCFSSDLAEPGAYRCFDDLGVPIIVLRNGAGELRAMLNACSHRNGRLVEGCGVARRLSCPYHAWTFDLDGTLKAIYKRGSFGEIDMAKYGLTLLPCQEKYGMVYVSPDPDGVVDIDAILGEFATVFESWQLGDLQFVASHDFHMASNWKLALDTFCEGYHFEPLHRESVGDYALGNISAFDTFGPQGRNHRLAFPNKSLRDLAAKPRADWGPAATIFEHFQLVHFLYPNVSLLISPTACELFRIFPGKSATEHVTRYSCHFRAGVPLETEQQRAEAQAHFEFIVKVVSDEDYWVSGNIQKNMNTGLRTLTTFGRNEPALINMHRAFAAAVSH